MVQVGVAFDLEGTSVNLEDHRHGAHLDAAASFGLAIDREFAIAQLPHFIGGPDERVAEEIYELGQASLPLSRSHFLEEFLRRDTANFVRRFHDAEIKPREGLVDFIDWLRGMNVPYAIGSLTSRSQATSILNRSGLDIVFGMRVVLREDVREVKPAPDVYLKTAQLMGIASIKQIVFEDSPRGIVAAIAARSHPIGMPVILQEPTMRALRNANACAIFTDWRDPALREYVRDLLPLLADRQEDGAGSPCVEA